MVEAVEKYGCIVLLDALGTKGRWKRDSALEILQTWESLIRAHKMRFNNLQVIRTDFSKFNAYSDTIMIATAGSDEAMNFLRTAISVSFLVADAMMKGIFFRGCISVGKYYWSESLLIGPAVDEAAQYYMMPEWIGVSTTPKAHMLLSTITPEKFKEDKIPKDLFVSYDIPLKNGIEKNGYALNTPQAYEFVSALGGIDLADKKPQKIETILTKQLSEIDDITAAFKIRNTLNFFKSVPKSTSEEVILSIKDAMAKIDKQ